MKSLLRELRPLLIYLLLSIAFMLLMTLATGKREPSGDPSAYWDGREPLDQAPEPSRRDSLPE
jgi:hypothetical protein